MSKLRYLFAGMLLYILLQPTLVLAAKKSATVRVSNVIEIPILVTHIIPLDHVGFDIPVIGSVSAKFGLREPYSSYLVAGKNSLGRTMLMNELIATGDNQDYWTPSEFIRGTNTFRARSLYIIEYNPSTEKFTVQNNDVGCFVRQAGIGHLFEKGTSVTPISADFPSGEYSAIGTLSQEPPEASDPAVVGPFAQNRVSSVLPADANIPPDQMIYTYDYFGGFNTTPTTTRLGSGCFRQFFPVADGTCITDSADSDQQRDIPESLFLALAEFDDAEAADLKDFALPKGVTEVHLEMENNLPAPLVRIDVNWEFFIWLDFRGYKDGVTPTYSLRGQHDQFPEYTVHIGDQLIYGFDGVKAGNGALSLASYQFVTLVPDEGLLVPRPFSGEIDLAKLKEVSKRVKALSTCN